MSVCDTSCPRPQREINLPSSRPETPSLSSASSLGWTLTAQVTDEEQTAPPPPPLNQPHVVTRRSKLKVHVDVVTLVTFSSSSGLIITIVQTSIRLM